ncbi:MAG: apolipoprotein N-acyltransferase [Nocardioides sp.]|jgi:apolipoprotein N-acyltransferase|nr:apolipoprotein N-acyltransferase [Nocardioides sp.]
MVTRGEAMMAALVGGLTLAAAFPPWSAPLLAPLGLGAFFLAVSRRGVPSGAVTGFVFGLAFFGPTLWWLSSSIAPLAWAALVLLQAAWLAALGAGTALVRCLSYWPVWVASLWTVVEAARSSVPWGGLPWGRLGYTAVDTPWSFSLALVGVAGTSTVVALAGAAVAGIVEAVRARRRVVVVTRPVLVGCLVGGVLLLVSVAWLPEERGEAATSRSRSVIIAVVQAEVPGDGTDVAAHHREITSTLLLETRRLARTWGAAAPAPDLVVWPENATAVDPATDSTAREALLTAVDVSGGAPMLAGSIVDGPTTTAALNQAVVWTTEGPAGRYTKQHLVPFGEYVPLRPIATRISPRVAEIERDMVSGAAPSPLLVDDLALAIALCFDVAYDDVLREQVAQGADLAVVQTSNAMFLGTAQQEQQWTITRARAIELGRSVVVSSMNGISGAIASDGSVIDRLPTARAGATAVSLPVERGTTLAVRLGAWPARIAYALGVAGVLAACWRARRERASGA